MNAPLETRFEYDPPAIRYGPRSVEGLGDELERRGLERALVVCGETVGSTPAVMNPVRDALGPRLGDTFAETTPRKRLETALSGHEAARECDADVLVAVGGGSSLDVAKIISLVSGTDRDPCDLGRELERTGTISTPGGPLSPIVAVPTTLAGADLSMVAGVTADPDSGLVERTVGGGISDPKLLPAAVVADPGLVATTPEPILFASAMNGFDKGVETLYARNATAITDATARRGLELLTPGLRRLGREGPSVETLEPVVEGLVCVQYGISRQSGTTLSLLHAFGHALTRGTDLHQGVAHGILAPHALESLFERVDGRRALLARALAGGGRDDATASDTTGAESGPADRDQTRTVVDAVTSVRDALGLPSRLRDVDGPDRDAFPDVARTVLDDSFVENAPPELDLSVADVEDVLEAAY